MKLPKWVTIVLIVSLLLNIKSSLDISAMKNEIRNLQGNVNSINYSLQNTVSSSMYRIDEMLKKEASLVNEFKYEYLEYKDKRIDFLLTLKPKVYKKGEKLSFLLKAGKNSSQLIPAESEDNVTFTVKINMSIFDGADIDLVIEDENSKRTERLESIYPAVEKFAAQISAHPLRGSMSMGTDNGNSVLFVNYDFELINNSKHSDSPAVLKDVNLSVEVNGKIIDTMPMLLEDSVESDRYYISLKGYKIPSKADDSIIIYATAKDDKGFNYKCYLEGWGIKADGNLDHSPNRYHFKEVEIY